MNRAGVIAILVTLLSTSNSGADDVRGASRFLCTAAEVTACFALGECVSLPPWELNVPQFIEIDLTEKVLATTAASGLNRSTPIKNLERVDGLIVLQGFEMGRAFSFVITEATGRASIAVAREDLAVTVFGACTPLGAEVGEPQSSD